MQGIPNLFSNSPLTVVAHILGLCERNVTVVEPSTHVSRRGTIRSRNDQPLVLKEVRYGRFENSPESLAASDRRGPGGGISGRRAGRMGLRAGDDGASPRIAYYGEYVRHGDFNQAVQGRTGLHPKRRHAHYVYGLHKCAPISRRLAVSWQLCDQCNGEGIQVECAEAGSESRGQPENQC